MGHYNIAVLHLGQILHFGEGMVQKINWHSPCIPVDEEPKPACCTWTESDMHMKTRLELSISRDLLKRWSAIDTLWPLKSEFCSWFKLTYWEQYTNPLPNVSCGLYCEPSWLKAWKLYAWFCWCCWGPKCNRVVQTWILLLIWEESCRLWTSAH